MRPEQWLRLGPVLRCRQKLRSWSRRDVMALAVAVHGSFELDKPQIAVLIQTLKTAVSKPDPINYKDLPEETEAQLRELRWFDNGEFESAAATAFTPGASSLVLKFATEADVAAWALTLLELDARASWAELKARWKKMTRLSGFVLPSAFTGYELTPEAQCRLERQQRKDQKLRLPLPDNAGVLKRYWSLELGDVVPHESGDHVLEVKHVRINLGSAPTITFERKELL